MTVKISILMSHLERIFISTASVPISPPESASVSVKKLLTEDTGKILEYALCKVLQTPFNGNFKYSEEKANVLAQKLSPLKTILADYKHTGNHNNLYDFMKSSAEHLSVKSVKHKSSWKVCPQIIGQTTKKKFNERFILNNQSLSQLQSSTILTIEEQLKIYIENNYIYLLEEYIKNTFHSPILFYCEQTEEILLITLITPIDWSSKSIQFLHKKNNKLWNESATLKIINDNKELTLGEFQIHNHRDGVKFRFNFKTLLNIFCANFVIQKYN
jgi:hypothetical protein